MRENLSEIVCVLDRSGSMESLREDAIGGFNAFLEEQKQNSGEARFTLVLFDHEYDLVHDGIDLRDAPGLNRSSFVPRGTTALFDAVGRTIDDVGRRLSETPESERPSRVIVSILTDGFENASCDYDNERIAEMIGHQQEKYGWEFIFLAANQDAIATARKMSIRPEDAFSFLATSEGVREAHALISRKFTDHRKR